MSSKLAVLQTEMVDQAIKIGQHFQVNLDFSDQSILSVEKILSELHDEFKHSQDDEIIGFSTQLGFYIITVVEKNHGKGDVEKDHPTFGKDTYPFYWSEKTLFPIAWCQKRIKNDSDDNIWKKYQILILDNDFKT